MKMNEIKKLREQKKELAYKEYNKIRKTAWEEYKKKSKEIEEEKEDVKQK